ncbi:MAG: peptidoglycan DD-metalloendopeptidase family protein [Proteobacteria bacterium]|nr:peptidoglycan DD-metalloendopeptidase family protein [Pseudomonadota bacterium]
MIFSIFLQRNLAAAYLLSASAVFSTAAAQSTNDLKNVQQEMESNQKKADELANKAAALDREVSDLQTALISAAADVQKREREVTEIENTLASLGESEQEKEAALLRGRKELAATLVALQRLSTMPRQALLFSPQKPIDMARSARLLSVTTPVLDGRARSLQSELNEIKELRQEMAHRRDDLTAALAKLAGENKRLSDLVAKKSGLRQSTLAETDATKQRLQRLADQAKNLQDLIARLEQTQAQNPTDAEDAAESNESGDAQVAALTPDTPKKTLRLKKPADLRAFPKDISKLTRPVNGKVVTKFGSTTETAGSMKGAEVETRPGAQIVATFDGQIVFEGPFRGYGQILIIEHTGGYHTILAGLDRVVVEVGQWLKAGEPIGRMGAAGKLETASAAEAGSAGGDSDSNLGDGRPRLYVELRHNGQPFDPAPIFKTNNN